VTLIVDFPEFVEVLRTFGSLNAKVVFYRKALHQVYLTHADPERNVQIISTFLGSVAEVARRLEEAGYQVLPGAWISEASLEYWAKIMGRVYVAGVAYHTPSGPGLWMDAYSSPPTEAQVLRALFGEFREEGLVEEGDFERFLAEAKPTVQVLSPEEVERFLAQKGNGGIGA
jgi:hypothetical protein